MTSQARLSLTALFITSSIIWISGNGILPLLPIYAESLGANNFEIGLYLAFSYACLAMGAVVAAKTVHSQHSAKQIMVISGALSIPIIFCVGQARSLYELVAFTSLIWLLGGAGFSALNSMMAKLTDHKHRGKVMGLLAITSPIGSVIGGAFSGPIVDLWGFDALFFTLALINMLWPVCGLMVRTDESITTIEIKTPTRVGSTVYLPRVKQQQHWNYQLISAASLSYMSYYIALLATSLIMKDAGYSATEISSTAIIGGLAAIPFIYGASHASDIFGRKAFWIFSNLIGAIALILLSVAESIVTFWIAAFMIRFLSSGSRSIGSAWIIDLCSPNRTIEPTGHRVHTETLVRYAPSINFLKNQWVSIQGTHIKSNAFSEEKALALISATPWIGGIMGYLAYGSASLTFTASSLLITAVVIPLLSIGLVLTIKHSPFT
ncbi:MFS transporter [Litoribrevibacter albus]|uniref:MFS transporter n=1 Tax=Litoribrevibacter albus TaxID=1473156 RepID=A0AA37SAH2_9GAMM|nr:MFS transporter [Litoribrevibacter albus]GLQ31082.1 hypothetical protein GCM10007876_15610 [Litoribrevibacter albus]